MSNIPDIIQHLMDKKILDKQIEDALLEYQKLKSSNKKINFGKYKGKTISEIKEFDEKYLSWLIKQPWIFEDIKKELERIL